MANTWSATYKGVWGQSSQQGPGAEPLVRRSGGKAPEAENLLKYWTSKKSESEPIFTLFSVLQTANYQ